LPQYCVRAAETVKHLQGLEISGGVPLRFARGRNLVRLNFLLVGVVGTWPEDY